MDLFMTAYLLPVTESGFRSASTYIEFKNPCSISICTFQVRSINLLSLDVLKDSESKTILGFTCLFSTIYCWTSL